MSPKKFAPLLFCVLLAACASAPSPEDAQMANSLCEQGKVLLKSGKNTNALDVYTSATTRDPQNSRAWNGLGVAYDLTGNKIAAKSAYQSALDLAPNDLSVVNNLAHLYLETNQPEEAVALLELHANDGNVPATLLQNLDTARKAVAATSTEVYAELGSYPTEGMARGHLSEVTSLLNDKNVTISIMPEVRIGGGTPTFTLKATGRSPISICADMNAEAIPCLPHGK